MIFNAYQDTNKGIAGVSVVSCGHIFAHHGRMIDRPKGRSDFLLFYVAKGREIFCLDGETVADEGSFILFRPFEKQKHIYTENSTGEFYYIHFNAPDSLELFGFKSSVVYTSKPSSEVREIFEEIIEELQAKQPEYERICVSKLFNVIALLERKSEKYTNPRRQYSDKISFVIQRMNTDFDKNYTLSEYARMCSMSKFHFLRVFKEITGSSPIEYRNKIRFERAKELLEDSNESVSEIGRSIGYDSNAYFCDAFKKRTGMSPVQYRKKRRFSNV